MNIVEFIEFLKQFPSDTEVHVAIGHYEEYKDNWTEHAPFDGKNGVEFVDYNNFPEIKPPYHLFGKRVLYLGDEV